MKQNHMQNAEDNKITKNGKIKALVSKLDLRIIQSFLAVGRSQYINKIATNELPTSTISSHLKRLHHALQLDDSQALFEKHGSSNKASMTLTPLGRQLFYRASIIEEHMRAMINIANQSRREITPIKVGIQNSTHRILVEKIIECLSPMKVGNSSILPKIDFSALRPEELLQKIDQKEVDIIVTQLVEDEIKPFLDIRYDVKPLFQQKLILISSDPNCLTLNDICTQDDKNGRGSRFINIDWGNSHEIYQSEVFRDFPGMIVDHQFNRSTAALAVLLNQHKNIQHYCCAFLPERRVQKYLKNAERNKGEKRLYRVEGDYQSSQDVYLINRKLETDENIPHYELKTRMVALQAINEAICKAINILS